MLLPGRLPVDGASNTLLDSKLSWLGDDTDGDLVTYGVYLESGNTDPAILVCDDAAFSECTPASNLAALSNYYWKVVARDEQGLESTSQVWSFTTGMYDSTESIFLNGFE
ncbi:MAG: hypothetical protein QNK22_04205 [Xanthomonadales bacterium]|nr:hypothetical protein [Xanthomonadales bacterium]